MGGKLAALERRLQQQQQRQQRQQRQQWQQRQRRGEGSSSAAEYPLLACMWLYGTGRLASATGCGGRDAEQLVSSAALLLGSGRRDLQLLAAAGGRGEAAGMHLLTAYMLLNVAAEDGGAAALARALFAPPAATEWLAAATRLLLAAAERDGVGECQRRRCRCCRSSACAPRAWKLAVHLQQLPGARHSLPGASTPGPGAYPLHLDACAGNVENVAAYAAVCYHLLSPRFDVREAVAADAGLRQGMARMLGGPCLRSAVAVLAPAAAAEAAPRWQPPASAPEMMGNYLRQLHHATTALQVPCIQPDVAALLRPPPLQAQLRRMAAQLLRALPLECPAVEGVSPVTHTNVRLSMHCDGAAGCGAQLGARCNPVAAPAPAAPRSPQVWLSAIQLLGLALGAQRYWLEREPRGQQAAAAARREAAWALVALLPRIAAGVRTAARSRVLELDMQLGMASVVTALSEHLAHAGSVRSAAEAAHVLQAADAAVSQLLPHAHALWQQRQAAAGQQLPAVDAELAATCLRLLTTSYVILKGGAYDPASGSDTAPPGSPAEHAAAVEAARRLQVTALRAVHWAAGAASAPAWLASVGAPYSGVLELHEACHVAQEAAEIVVEASGSLAAGGDTAHAQELRRWVQRWSWLGWVHSASGAVMVRDCDLLRACHSAHLSRCACPHHRRLQAEGVGAARFHSLLRVLSGLGAGATQGRTRRDAERSMSQLLSLASEAPPALLTDASLDLLARVTAAAVSRGERG